MPLAATACCSCPTSRASAARTPTHWPVARSSGLTVTHERRHLTRSVLEGVAFGLRDGLDQMIAAGMPEPAQVRASGGGTASPVWRQILADVLRAEIATVDTTEGAAYGAALLAAVGAGWFPTVEAATGALVTATPVASAGPDVARYAEAHAIYRDLYPALGADLPPAGSLIVLGAGVVRAATTRGARSRPCPRRSPRRASCRG